jgi:hypothetical protein
MPFSLTVLIEGGCILQHYINVLAGNMGEPVPNKNIDGLQVIHNSHGVDSLTVNLNSIFQCSKASVMSIIESGR